MKWYPWLRPHFETLIASYQAGRGHHALLVQALPGMGDDALIYALSRWLMCQHPDGQRSCGKCHSCQLMQAGTHPDYYSLAPEKGKSSLGIDAVRDVSEKLYERSRLGGAKVIWIHDAALLTDAAGNALLKTLEEPPENTWFFLACREPARLLATLRSRCLLYHLAPPAEHYALAWLQREVTVSHDVALTALRLCANAPAAALEMIQSGEWETRAQLTQALEHVMTSHDWLTLLPVLNHDNVARRLHWLVALLLDAQKIQRNIYILMNEDARLLTWRLAQSWSVAQLQAIVHDACECREQLLTVTGLNRELTLTERLLRWEYYLQPGAELPVSHL